MSYDFYAMLLAGITLGFSAGISPGPLMALTISETLKYGTKAWLIVAFIPLITDLPIIATSLLIISQFQNLTYFLAAISIMGALYLFYLGYENLKLQKIKIEELSVINSSFKKGVITNYTNPNPYIFWITIGGPILISSSNQSIVNSLAFISTFYIFLVGIKAVTVFIGGRFRTFFKSPRYIFTIKFMGLMLIIFGIILLVDAYNLIQS